MAGRQLSPEELERRVKAIAEYGNITAAAQALGIPRTTMNHAVEIARRAGWEESPLAAPPGRLDLAILDGTVIVFSDSHWWPGPLSTANRALLHFCRELRPKAVIANGDLLDGATISRHPPLGWEKRPSLAEELEAVKERLGEITVAADSSRRFWCCGNHDARFEVRLATVAPEYARVQGVHLKDHIDPDWEPCWSVWINGHTVVKHRIRGGVHGPHNSTLWAGKSTVTGHRHGLGVWPLTDYNNTRFAVDTGTLARPFGPHTEYMEDNPRNHRSGFGVLTYVNGRLLYPEVVFVSDEEAGIVDFRGQAIQV